MVKTSTLAEISRIGRITTLTLARKRRASSRPSFIHSILCSRLLRALFFIATTEMTVERDSDLVVFLRPSIPCHLYAMSRKIAGHELAHLYQLRLTLAIRPAEP